MKHHRWKTLIFMSVLIFQRSFSAKASKIENFISNIFLEKFSECTIFFFRDSDSNASDRLLRRIVTLTGSAYYNIQYSYTTKLSPEMENFPVKFRNLLSMYNRKRDVCKFVILPINDIRKEYFQQIFRIITPVYIPPTRKDVDPFIYVTKLSLVDKLLLSYDLPARTKYKLAVAEDEKLGELVIKSVCFFCNEGNPRIIQFPSNENPRTFNYFPDYVLNLNGKVVRITCPAIKSRIEVDPPFNGINNAKRGMWKTLFEEFLMVKFNFTYNIFLSTGGGGTGLELQNGTVGDLAEGRADFGIITANTPKRIKQVSFSNSFFDIGYLDFITAAGQRVYSPWALLWSFDTVMWCCIILSTCFAFFIFKFLTASMIYLGMDGEDSLSFARRGIVSKEAWGLKHQIFFVATSYLDQDCSMPRVPALRCFVALWLFFTLIITTVYRTKMVSLLAFPILEQLPQTFQELVSSDFQVGFIKHGDSAYNTLKASSDPVYVKLLSEMDIITGNGLECLQRVVSKRYACIAYDFSTVYLKARNLSDSDIRKLVFSSERTYNIFMGLVMEGGSLYKESFERWLGWTRPFHLANLFENQDMYYNVRLPKRSFWMATNQTENFQRSDAEGSDDLTLKHISGAFYSWLICLGFCMIVFLQEFVTSPHVKFYLMSNHIIISLRKGWKNKKCS